MSPKPTPRTGEHANDSVTTLRGATPMGVGRGFWFITVSIILAVSALVLIVTFVSAQQDNARINRLQSHGIAVTATIDTCIGNLGGSGSNASSYTCRATYVVGSRTYDEVVGLMSAFASPGTRVAVVADPSRPSTIELASALAASRSSKGAYLIPGLLALVWIALSVSLWRRRRRTISQIS